MALAIGRANMKWFGSPAIGQTITNSGFTAITSVGNIAGIGTATMMRDTMIAGIGRTIVTTTDINQSIT